MCICTKMGIWSLLGVPECGTAALRAMRTPGICERTSRTYYSSTSIEALARILPWAAASSGGLVVFVVVVNARVVANKHSRIRESRVVVKPVHLARSSGRYRAMSFTHLCPEYEHNTMPQPHSRSDIFVEFRRPVDNPSTPPCSRQLRPRTRRAHSSTCSGSPVCSADVRRRRRLSAGSMDSRPPDPPRQRNAQPLGARGISLCIRDP